MSQLSFSEFIHWHDRHFVDHELQAVEVDHHAFTSLTQHSQSNSFGDVLAWFTLPEAAQKTFLCLENLQLQLSGNLFRDE